MFLVAVVGRGRAGRGEGARLIPRDCCNVRLAGTLVSMELICSPALRNRGE